MRSVSLLYVFLLAATAQVCLSAQQPDIPPPASRRVMQSVDNDQRTTLSGNVHPLARAEFDHGQAPADLPLGRMLMVLKRSPEQEAALARLIEDQQDVRSPSYHQWLTPQQFGDRFGPAQADIDAVTQWLTANGFQIGQVSRSRMFIEFSGSAQSVAQAFRSPIHSFIVNGEQHWANAANPTIPAALAPVVAGVNSLHNFQKQAQNIPLGAYSVASHSRLSHDPAYTYGGGTNQVSDYAIVPYDFATIYDLLPLWSATPTPINGAGQTIAIVGRSDINPADAPTLWRYFGLDGVHAPQPKLVITYNGPNPGKTADEPEADIDTQWSGSVAPGATINYVASASTATTDGIDLSALYIVDNNIAPVLSESYGTCETALGASGVQFYGALWQQAAAQGISVFVSSGDSGAAGCDSPNTPAQDGLQVNGIASTPFDAAVGGTDFNQYQTWTTYWNSTNAAITGQSAKGYIPETTWNDSCTNALYQFSPGGSTNAEANCNDSKAGRNSVAGGGGQSSSWLKPTWQTGTPNDNARDLPDVSLFASNGFLNSYYLVCQSDIYPSGGACDFGSFSGFGGTSVSSPQFAAIMALVNQKTGSAQGIPGLTLYKLAAQHPTAFHDVAAGSTIAVPCVTGKPNCTTTNPVDAYGILNGYNTATGYDLATGLGSVDIATLVNQWQSVSFTPSATSLSLNGGSAVNITHGAAVSFNIGVTPTAATGEAALMIAPGTPGDPGIAAFPLASGLASGTTALLPGGSYNILAHYSGDATYGGSYSNVVAVNVTPETSAAFVNLIATDINGVPTSYSMSSATYGAGNQYLRVDVGDAHASVSPSTGISSLCASRKETCPTGVVILSAPGTSLDGKSLLLNNEGFAQMPVPTPGTYTVTATYHGDASFAASSATTSFTIAKAPTTVAAAFATTVEYGSLADPTATVNTTSDGVAPTGTFQFYVDGAVISGTASPNSGYGYGGYVNGTYYYATLGGTLLTNFVVVGNHTLSAQYSGDANYAAATSPQTNFMVLQDTPNFLTLGASNATGTPIVAGQSAMLNATVDGSYPGAHPTGTITFSVNNVVISGTVSYTSTTSPALLNATIPTVFASPGTYTLSASYSGDANYTSASYPTPQNVTILGPISIARGAGIVVSSPGLSGSTSISVTPNGGFSGTAIVSCTPDPTALETTCSLTSGSTSGSSVQVNVSGSGASLTFNIATTAPHQMARQNVPPSGGPSNSSIAFAGMVILIFPAIRRRRTTFLCVLGLCLTLGLGACGGGASSKADPGTGLAQYSYTVTATTGTGASQYTTTTQVPVLVN